MYEIHVRNLRKKEIVYDNKYIEKEIVIYNKNDLNSNVIKKIICL